LPESSVATRPRLGFLGTGWIGRQRMEAVAGAGAAEVAAVADADEQTAHAAAKAVGCTSVYRELDALLELPLDGIVIATPTALHAPQAARALEAGRHVFCQKPLGRTEPECRELIELARRRDLALGVDMSYRHLAATAAVRDQLPELGRVHALELTFHNAYGPDKAWAHDIALAGGGALIDLGCHLLDLADELTGPLEPMSLHADLLRDGRLLAPPLREVEDLALAQLRTHDGRVIRLACSWWLAAGREAVIEVTLLGADRALRITNVAGSFYDFRAERLDGRQTQALSEPGDDWSAGAITAWARRVGAGAGFDPEVERVARVAGLVDRIYGRPPCGS
jgi:predicted dehydrogenase